MPGLQSCLVTQIGCGTSARDHMEEPAPEWPGKLGYGMAKQCNLRRKPGVNWTCLLYSI